MQIYLLDNQQLTKKNNYFQKKGAKKRFFSEDFNKISQRTENQLFTGAKSAKI